MTVSKEDVEAYTECIDRIITHTKRFNLVAEQMREIQEAIGMALPFYIMRQGGHQTSLVAKWFDLLEQLGEATVDVSQDWTEAHGILEDMFCGE